ncbi:hypothetical protein G6F56_010286 [Rhizopus delemar]|nr:hypothetical protein G6F56_010286 [Rhizopus delemar]
MNQSFEYQNNPSQFYYYESINDEEYMERECYADYDQEMNEAMEEADDMDQYYSDEEYDYQNDSLLCLILGVQNYLAEQTKMYGNKVTESPLYGLQYKMYTYMRQRASELGVDV